MTKKFACILFLLGAQLLFSGCANQSIATMSPGSSLGNPRSFYVVRLEADKRGVNILIRDRLIALGYTAESGEEKPFPKNHTDVVVTYEDRWAWDVTMYMLQLTITFRDPSDGYPMVVGKSLHSSLTRKSPEAMVQEVLTSIFNKVNHGS